MDSFKLHKDLRLLQVLLQTVPHLLTVKQYQPSLNSLKRSWILKTSSLQQIQHTKTVNQLFLLLNHTLKIQSSKVTYRMHKMLALRLRLPMKTLWDIIPRLKTTMLLVKLLLILLLHFKINNKLHSSSQMQMASLTQSKLSLMPKLVQAMLLLLLLVIMLKQLQHSVLSKEMKLLLNWKLYNR